MADQVLEIDHISKRYGDLVALHDLSFGVRGGEVFGFVGSNGAGKTTTMRVVMVPDAGDVCWQGRPLFFETRRHFGYMPGGAELYPGEVTDPTDMSIDQRPRRSPWLMTAARLALQGQARAWTRRAPSSRGLKTAQKLGKRRSCPRPERPRTPVDGGRLPLQ